MKLKNILKIIVVFIVFVIMLNLLGCKKEDVLRYKLLEDNTYELEKATIESQSINIPQFYNNKYVTHIGNNAFKGCLKLESITIPESITNIGDSAFNGCNNLKEVKIKNLNAWYNLSFTVYFVWHN